jgi:hypothetical protein
MSMRLPALQHKVLGDSTPDKEGVLHGYCVACACMIMEGEEECPKCKGEAFTAMPPDGKDFMRTAGLTRASTANPIRNPC